MKECVPDAWLSEEHATWTRAGSEAATDLILAVFPPRPEDAHGTLAVSTLEVTASSAIRQAFVDIANPAVRRWWLEGFVSGCCGQSAQALVAACELMEADARAELDRMHTHVKAVLDADQRAAVDIVFELTHALMADDEVACAWALEALFVPEGQVTHEKVTDRVRNVCNAAVLTCCACWQLLVLHTAGSD